MKRREKEEERGKGRQKDTKMYKATGGYSGHMLLKNRQQNPHNI